jgi:multidrug efflux pump subunit AcrA (membrane-fusion protein)
MRVVPSDVPSSDEDDADTVLADSKDVADFDEDVDNMFANLVEPAVPAPPVRVVPSPKVVPPKVIPPVAVRPVGTRPYPANDIDPNAPPPGMVFEIPPPIDPHAPPPGMVFEIPPPIDPHAPPPGVAFEIPPPLDPNAPPPNFAFDAVPNAAEIAEQEQAHMLATERKRAWHQRRWLRFLMVLAVLVGIMAVIPYPLRITAECAIIPRERVNVRSELQGVISQILVEEGQAVKKGDVIAKLDDRALQAERRKTLAEIERYQAEVAILKKGSRKEEIQRQEAIVAARKTEAAYAGKEAYRRGQMVRQGVGSLQESDSARGGYEARRRALSEAQAQLELLKAGARPEEIAAREAVLKRANAELEFVDQRIAMTVIHAPIDGEIITPRFRERLNENVEIGGLICEIANTTTMRAEIFVPQRDVDAVGIGMPVTVKVESHPTHPFEGKVVFVSPAVDDKERRVRVVAELDNAAGLLKPNMTGYGEIESGDRSVLHLVTRRIVRWVRVRFLI